MGLDGIDFGVLARAEGVNGEHSIDMAVVHRWFVHGTFLLFGQ
jgi:hypothetical protein